MSPLEALLLDLDNTLIDRDAAFDRALGAWFPAADLPALRALDGRGRVPRDRFCRAVVGRWPGRWADAQAFWADFRPAVAEAVRPDPSITQAVAALSKRYRLAVVSNGGPGQRRKLARAGLAPPDLDAFEVVLISGEVGWDKPDPRVFRAALAALGVAPGAAMMVGDDPVRDIAGAAAMGIRTCQVLGPGEEASASAGLAIAGFSELPEALGIRSSTPSPKTS